MSLPSIHLDPFLGFPRGGLVLVFVQGRESLKRHQGLEESPGSARMPILVYM
jgi:hypothetical protein